jgi:branched-chain amino acid transport system ATP-binding protein
MPLRIESLSAFHGRIQALHSVSAYVDEGEIVAILGANGAGKSTLMQTIMGLVNAQAGSITFDGMEISRARTQDIVRLGVGLVPERRLLFAPMTVEENLRLGLFLLSRKLSRTAVTERFEEIYGLFPVLSERRTQISVTLSGGEQQMLAIGRALISRPKLLLLDEPFMGLAPIVIGQLIDALGRINRESRLSIIVTEQHTEDALNLAHRGYVLRVGRVAMEGDSQALLASPDLSTLYL